VDVHLAGVNRGSRTGQITAVLGMKRTVTCPRFDSCVDALLHGRRADNLAVRSVVEAKPGNECEPASATWRLSSTDVDVFSPVPPYRILRFEPARRVRLLADRIWSTGLCSDAASGHLD
jgi:hypothetical protein